MRILLLRHDSPKRPGLHRSSLSSDIGELGRRNSPGRVAAPTPHWEALAACVHGATREQFLEPTRWRAGDTAGNQPTTQRVTLLGRHG